MDAHVQSVDPKDNVLNGTTSDEAENSIVSGGYESE